MFCHKCGADLISDANFCNKCGVKIESVMISDAVLGETPASESGVSLIPNKKGFIKKKVIQISLIVIAFTLISKVVISCMDGSLAAMIENSGDVNAGKYLNISKSVRLSMQKTFDTDAKFKDRNLQVTSVQVLNSNDNKYSGIAVVVCDGEAHDVIVEVIVDGGNIMWQTEPGALLF